MAWVASGRLVDAILLLMVVELSVLIIIRNRTGVALSSLDLAVGLSAGAALLLALRAALDGAGGTSIALWLFLALLAHLADLRRRWTAARTR